MQNNWLINSYKQHLSYAHQKSNPFDFKSIILRQRDITCSTLYDTSIMPVLRTDQFIILEII